MKAVKPYIYPNQLNFKNKPFEAWKALGGETVNGWYPRILHRLMYQYDMPALWHGEARLCFVQPVTLHFDTFFSGIMHEIIPFFWDCWPNYFHNVCKWLEKNNVRTAIFTSSQVTEMIKSKYPQMNVMWCPEGIDVDSYSEGLELQNRGIDFFEYGRNMDNVVKYDFANSMVVIRGQKNGVNTLSRLELLQNLQNAKVIPCFPKNITDPQLGGNIETLTQRYWECMLSRAVLVGHAPSELINVLGYNPVIEIDIKNPNEQLHSILDNINDYQDLVDKNREAALKLGSWKLRMKELMEFLMKCGYEC